MAEQVERHDAVPALRQRARQRLVHALVEQQAVQQHGQPRALAVDRVGQPLAVDARTLLIAVAILVLARCPSSAR